MSCNHKCQSCGIALESKSGVGCGMIPLATFVYMLVMVVTIACAEIRRLDEKAGLRTHEWIEFVAKVVRL